MSYPTPTERPSQKPDTAVAPPLHRSWNTTSRRIALCLILLLLNTFIPDTVQAHSPDTSYARLEISKQRLELKVTYDLFTLHKITPLDDNRDHRITREELEKHLPEIQKFLAASVELEVQGLDAGLGKPIGFTWPKDAEEGVAEKDFHSPAFLIPFRFERAIDDLPEEVTLTFRLFSKLGDRHSILGKFVYDGKESEVTFNQFEPDFSFETGYEPPLYRRIQKFFKLGMEHIFFGFDHLCFLLALFVVATPRDLLKIITSFTLAHTITLLLAALNVVRLPSRLVESSIALTIVYVAAENLWPKPRPHRWALTFAFGLIHGFGFASVLESLALPSSGLIRCLLSFNVGVEVGQLVIVAAFLPLVLLLRNARYGILTARIISCGLATIGTAWFLDRVLSLGWMPI